MNRIGIRVGENSYDILIGHGLIDQSGELIREIKEYRRCAVVTDSTVNRLYGNKLKKSLESIGMIAEFIILDPGEELKNLRTAEFIVEELLRLQMTRSDLLITFGGGVICDVGGFVSAVYKRGMDLIHIPTTLLAQVDASIGGKVGVNLEAGKNLVGAFKQPKLIISDVDLLKTMDDRIFRGGMGEVIKYACIESESMFEKLEETSNREEVRDSVVDIISLCASIKRKYIENDEFDTGMRKILNFGHTIAHALEKYSGYGHYTHGEAVAVGMYNITLITEAYNLTRSGTAARLKSLIMKYNLPYKLDMPVDVMFETAIYDKKYHGTSIDLVVLKQIGDAYLRNTKLSELNLDEIRKILED